MSEFNEKAAIEEACRFTFSVPMADPCIKYQLTEEGKVQITKLVHMARWQFDQMRDENERLRSALNDLSFHSSCSACKENQIERDKALKGGGG